MAALATAADYALARDRQLRDRHLQAKPDPYTVCEVTCNGGIDYAARLNGKPWPKDVHRPRLDCHNVTEAMIPTATLTAVSGDIRTTITIRCQHCRQHTPHTIGAILRQMPSS